MKKRFILVCFAVIILGIGFYISYTYQSKNSYKNYKGTKLQVKEVSLQKDSQSNTYKIPKQFFENGIMYQYTFDNKKEIELKKGDIVKVKLSITEEESVSLVYEYDKQFSDIYIGSINKELETEFTAKKDGKYSIYSVGSAATTTEVTNGQIVIVKSE